VKGMMSGRAARAAASRTTRGGSPTAVPWALLPTGNPKRQKQFAAQTAKLQRLREEYIGPDGHRARGTVPKPPTWEEMLAQAAGDKSKLAALMRRHQSPAEKALGNALRARGIPHSPQALIYGYIVDFQIHETDFLVEVDGRHHERQASQDQLRTSHLNAQGYRILRFSAQHCLREPHSAVNEIVAKIKAAGGSNFLPRGPQAKAGHPRGLKRNKGRRKPGGSRRRSMRKPA